jgi:hypothetical protein
MLPEQTRSVSFFALVLQLTGAMADESRSDSSPNGALTTHSNNLRISDSAMFLIVDPS